MKVQFFSPPAEQRVGGLDAAIENLRSALIRRGVEVFDETNEGEAEPDVVHFHGLWQLRHARAARQFLERKVPYIVSPHGMLEPWAWRHKRWKKWPYFQLIERRYLANAAGLLATAQPEAQRLTRFLSRPQVETLPLGLTGKAKPDYRKARGKLGWASEEIVLLFLSRVHPKKGLDLLLRALASMKWPAVTRLVIVGDGERDYVEGLKRYAGDHASTLPRIDWVGAVWGEGRWPYFQGADLFCLPSHSENFGLAVLEACQAGTSALTTVDTPWADELTDGRGYIAAPTVEELRNTLQRFFATQRRTEAQRDELSQWAWSRFDWDQLAPRYVQFYERIAQGIGR